MFEMCLNAKTILLPETSSVVGNFAFGSSMYLESMVIPDGVQSVGKSAFISCYSLKQVTFGAGVTSIGSDVFYQCSALEIARQAGWDDTVSDIETRVRTAISALETAGYVKRGRNVPHVYATGILVKNMSDAVKILEASDLLEEKDKDESYDR